MEECITKGKVKNKINEHEHDPFDTENQVLTPTDSQALPSQNNRLVSESFSKDVKDAARLLCLYACPIALDFSSTKKIWNRFMMS